MAAVVAFSSCRKDEDAPVTPTPDPTTVNLEISHMAGANALTFNTNYTDGFGNVFTITRADMYVNGFTLVDDVDTVLFEDNNHYLLKPTVTSVSFGEIAATHVHALSFNVGVDTTLNLTVDPTTQPAGSALGVQSPSMYWSWSSGYRFVVIEGNADRNADGVAETPYQFHIGMNALYRSVELHVHTDMTANTANMIHMEIDYLRFFDGIDMSLASSSTHTMDNMMLATQFINNVDSVFSVHTH